jgi:hypothetical protein
LDGGSGDWEREVLESAAGDAPSPEFRKRIAKELGVLASIATLTSATTVAGQTLGTIAWIKLLGVGAVMGLATAGVSYAVSDGPAPPAPREVPAVRKPATAPLPPPQAIEPTDEPKTVVPPPRAPSDAAPEPTTRKEGIEKHPAAAPDPALPSRATMTPTDSALAEELRAIEKIRRALAAGDPTAALSALDRYEAVPGPKLFAEEAQVLRIEALARQGNDAGARALAGRFLTQHPESPYVERVRSLVRDKP